jgi:hypothetical protein
MWMGWGHHRRPESIPPPSPNPIRHDQAGASPTAMTLALLIALAGSLVLMAWIVKRLEQA